MECKDNERISELQAFKEFRDPGTPQFWRPDTFYKMDDRFDDETHFSDASYTNKERKPVYLRCRSRLKRHLYDHPRPFSCRAILPIPKSNVSSSTSQSTSFEQRQMTTIQEEEFFYKRELKFRPKSYERRNLPKETFRMRRQKAMYKAASLKTIVNRLNKMCLAKPEVLPNKPEEVMKLFSDIQI